MGEKLRPLTDTEPIRFAKPLAWELGYFHSFWGRFAVSLEDQKVVVAKCRPWPHPPEWTVSFHPVVLTRPLLCGDRVMVSQWIRAAVEKRSKKKRTALVRDAFLHDGRDALCDFMTDVDAGGGSVREPSPLMVVMTEVGCRCGIRDDDAGGWCWREGATVSEALDAVEKALKAGEGAFRAQRNGFVKKRK